MKIKNYFLLIIILLQFVDASMSQTIDCPYINWATKAGGESFHERGVSIAVDTAGNSYVLGIFEDVSLFGNDILTSSGSSDIFVAKLNPQGEFLWAKKVGGISQDYGEGIAVDHIGNIYITGSYSHTATFGSIVLEGDGFGSQMFVSKLNSQGQFLWAKTTGGYGSSYGTSIVVDTEGNSHVTGAFYGTVTFGSITLPNFNGYVNTFITKVNDQGEFIWAKKIGVDNNYIEGLDIDVDHVGNTYVTGSFIGDATFGDTTLATNPSGGDYDYDVFVTKINEQGDFLWARKVGGFDRDIGYKITVDSLGNSYVMGEFYGIISFGDSIQLTGGSDGFITKLNDQGEFLWAIKAGKQSFGRVDIHNHSLDENYVTGYFVNSIYLGDTTLTTTGQSIFVAKLNGQGEFSGGQQVGGEGYLEIYSQGLDVDINGNAYIIGYFYGTINYDSDILTSSGFDILISKLSWSDGTIDFTPSIFNYSHNGLTTFFSNTENNSSAFLWNFGDGTTSEDENPIHVYGVEGEYNVCLTIENTCGEIGTTCQPILIYNNLGIKDNEKEEFLIYPNPTDEILNIAGGNVKRLRVMSLNGQEIMSSKNQSQINVSSFSSGLYFLEINGEKIYKININ